MRYDRTVHLDTDFATAVSRVREALAEQGFGILTEIDVTATLKAKLDHDMEDHKPDQSRSQCCAVGAQRLRIR